MAAAAVVVVVVEEVEEAKKVVAIAISEWATAPFGHCILASF